MCQCQSHKMGVANEQYNCITAAVRPGDKRTKIEETTDNTVVEEEPTPGSP